MDLNGSKWIQMDLNGSNGSKWILATLRSCCEVGIKDFFDLVFLILTMFNFTSFEKEINHKKYCH